MRESASATKSLVPTSGNVARLDMVGSRREGKGLQSVPSTVVPISSSDR